MYGKARVGTHTRTVRHRGNSVTYGKAQRKLTHVRLGTGETHTRTVKHRGNSLTYGKTLEKLTHVQ